MRTDHLLLSSRNAESPEPYAPSWQPAKSLSPTEAWLLLTYSALTFPVFNLFFHCYLQRAPLRSQLGCRKRRKEITFAHTEFPSKLTLSLTLRAADVGVLRSCSVAAPFLWSLSACRSRIRSSAPRSSGAQQCLACLFLQKGGRTRFFQSRSIFN